MSICYSPRTAAARRQAPRSRTGLGSGFCLGLAIAALIWAALGAATTVSLSNSVMANVPSVSLTR